MSDVLNITANIDGGKTVTSNVTSGSTVNGVVGSNSSQVTANVTPGNTINGQIVVGGAGPKGEPGPASTVPGPAGADSTVPGPTGPSNILSIGTVSEGTTSATLTGTSPNQILNLILAKGNPGANSVVPGPTGPASTVPGPIGPTSTVPGPANSLSIGTVSAGTTGAIITGTAPAQTLNLTLQTGATGANGVTPVKGVNYFDGTNGTNGTNGSAATIAVGTVSTGAAGSSATVTNAGTSSAAVFNMAIPQGLVGSTGAPGAGLPVGGSTAQILTKTSATDYAYTWQTPVAGVTDHTLLTNIGTNTHAQIDTHIANVANPHVVTKSQVGLSAVPNTDFTAPVAANTAKVSFDATSSTRLAGTSGTNTGDQTLPTLASLGAVPTTTTVNTKALSANVVLTPDDLDDTATTHKFATAAQIANSHAPGSDNQTIVDSATPAAEAFSSTAVVGVAVTASRSDHRHAMPATPTTITGNAGTATAIAITNDIATNATMFPTFVATASGNQGNKTSSSKLTYNPSTGVLSATGLTSTVAIGTAPLAVTSTTKVTNLNADTVDGIHASATPVANQLLALDGSGKLPISTLNTGAQAAYVATTEATVSTTYTDLTTVGPAVTLTIGSNGLALVSIGSKLYNNVNLSEAWMGFAISGASTVAATDSKAINVLATGANIPQVTIAGTYLITGLTPGSTTFTAKYRATSNTAGFQYRNLSVVAL